MEMKARYITDSVGFTGTDHKPTKCQKMHRCMSDMYYKSRFLILPKTIDGSTRWLEFASWEGLRHETTNAFNFDTDADMNWTYTEFSLRDKLIMLSIAFVKLISFVSIFGTILWYLLS